MAVRQPATRVCSGALSRVVQRAVSSIAGDCRPLGRRVSPRLSNRRFLGRETDNAAIGSGEAYPSATACAVNPMKHVDSRVGIVIEVDRDNGRCPGPDRRDADVALVDLPRSGVIRVLRE